MVNHPFIYIYMGNAWVGHYKQTLDRKVELRFSQSSQKLKGFTFQTRFLFPSASVTYCGVFVFKTWMTLVELFFFRNVLSFSREASGVGWFLKGKLVAYLLVVESICIDIYIYILYRDYSRIVHAYRYMNTCVYLLWWKEDVASSRVGGNVGFTCKTRSKWDGGSPKTR